MATAAWAVAPLELTDRAKVLLVLVVDGMEMGDGHRNPQRFPTQWRKTRIPIPPTITMRRSLLLTPVDPLPQSGNNLQTKTMCHSLARSPLP
jgi:hypothetical protein